MIITSQRLRENYKKLIKDYNLTESKEEDYFVKYFLEKQLNSIVKSLNTWTEEQKKSYKDFYKKILLDRSKLIDELLNNELK